MRVLILLLLILKSRTLTTITQRIERDVKKSGIVQQYSGTPGVKSNFRPENPGGLAGLKSFSFGHYELSAWYMVHLAVYRIIQVLSLVLLCNLHNIIPFLIYEFFIYLSLLLYYACPRELVFASARD